MVKKLYIPLLLSLSAPLFAGCVKEKTEVCYQGLVLHYSYDLNPQNENRFGSDVDKLTILAFDGDDNFYKSFVVDDPAMLGNDNLIHLPLPDGTWNIVTWGGDMASYEMDFGGSRSSGYDDYRLGISRYRETADGVKLVTEGLSRLYYGSVTGARSVTSTSKPVPTEAPMMQNTNTLKVILTGLPQATTREGHKGLIDVVADMANGRYRSNNLTCGDKERIRYAQKNAISDWPTKMEIDLTVLRLFTSDAESAITVSGEFLDPYKYPEGRITIPIVPTIMASPLYKTQTDLDRENIYTFEVKFDTEMNFTVTINGWKVINVITEI